MRNSGGFSKNLSSGHTHILFYFYFYLKKGKIHLDKKKQTNKHNLGISRLLINCNSIEIRHIVLLFLWKALPLRVEGDWPPVSFFFYYNRGAGEEMVSSSQIPWDSFLTLYVWGVENVSSSKGKKKNKNTRIPYV
jgi:hypothetical protein